MIIGIGIDLVEVPRMEKALQQEGFREKVFTEEEIAYCESKGAHRVESYAARFAAKEAVGKALGTGIQKGQLLDAEIEIDEGGRPKMHIMGQLRVSALIRHVEKIHVSLSHTASMAIAQIILEE